MSPGEAQAWASFALLLMALVAVVGLAETLRVSEMGAFCKPSRKKALRRAHLPEHRSELEKLRADPSLIPTAVEEIVRWVSPVIEFCRTADEDVEVAGTTIRAPTWRASSC